MGISLPLLLPCQVLTHSMQGGDNISRDSAVVRLSVNKDKCVHVGKILLMNEVLLYADVAKLASSLKKKMEECQKALGNLEELSQSKAGIEAQLASLTAEKVLSKLQALCGWAQ